jgi:hypothetical protein
MNSKTAEIRRWRDFCRDSRMWNRFARLFIIKTKFEAFLVIYGLGLGAVERGRHYMEQYPGYGGWLLFAACSTAVFMAGGRLIDSVANSPPD